MTALSGENVLQRGKIGDGQITTTDNRANVDLRGLVADTGTAGVNIYRDGETWPFEGSATPNPPATHMDQVARQSRRGHPLLNLPMPRTATLNPEHS